MTVAAHEKQRLDAAEHAWWDRVAHVYARERELLAPERALIERFRDSWHAWELLDLGVGAGRSALGFAGLVRRYVGVDYSPRMIEFARLAVAESERVGFAVADARELDRLGLGQFDVVLFTYNGLDSIHPLDRERTLAGIAGSLRPDGLFYFSAHNLFALPLARRPWPERTWRRPAQLGLRTAKVALHNARLARLSRRFDLGSAQREGHAYVIDGGENFSVPVPYVTPRYQIAQLERAGFTDVEVLDAAARPVDLDRPGREPWLHYVCRARAGARGARA